MQPKTYEGNQAHLRDRLPPVSGRRSSTPAMAARTDFSGSEGFFPLSPLVSAPGVLMTIPFLRSKGTFRSNDTIFIFIAWKRKRADRDFGQSELVVQVRLGSNPRGRTSPSQPSGRYIPYRNRSAGFPRGIFVDAVMPGEPPQCRTRSSVGRSRMNAPRPSDEQRTNHCAHKI
jgi:hypothetical protein